MVSDIEVKESLSQFTNPTTDFIHSIDPNEQFISSILNNLGKSSFSVPILPQNMTSVDAIVTMPVFTGGKRIYAGKIGKLMVDIAEINKEKISADQQILLVEAYYGLRLGQRIVEVKQETYDALEHHYQNALKLEANGMINKAERLFFQVNRDEAKRELEIAVKDFPIRHFIEINQNILYGNYGFAYSWQHISILFIYILLALLILPHLKNATLSHKYQDIE